MADHVIDDFDGSSAGPSLYSATHQQSYKKLRGAASIGDGLLMEPIPEHQTQSFSFKPERDTGSFAAETVPGATKSERKDPLAALDRAHSVQMVPREGLAKKHQTPSTSGKTRGQRGGPMQQRLSAAEGSACAASEGAGPGRPMDFAERMRLAQQDLDQKEAVSRQGGVKPPLYLRKKGVVEKSDRQQR